MKMFFYYCPCESVLSRSHQDFKKPCNSCMSWAQEGCNMDCSMEKHRNSTAQLQHLMAAINIHCCRWVFIPINSLINECKLRTSYLRGCTVVQLSVFPARDSCWCSAMCKLCLQVTAWSSSRALPPKTFRTYHPAPSFQAPCFVRTSSSSIQYSKSSSSSARKILPSCISVQVPCTAYWGTLKVVSLTRCIFAVVWVFCFGVLREFEVTKFAQVKYFSCITRILNITCPTSTTALQHKWRFNLNTIIGALIKSVLQRCGVGSQWLSSS